MPVAVGPLAALAGAVEVASLLDLDPELGEGLTDAEREPARRRALVRVESVAGGDWQPRRPAASVATGTGVFLAAGLFVHESRIGGRAFTELLGAGDVIYPWHARNVDWVHQEPWQALLPGRAALLDERLFVRISPFPSLALAIAERSVRRGRFLAALALTRRMRRTDERLLFLFSLLAERWGRVRLDGVTLSLPLTHELLARLIGTRRQAVTGALGMLRLRGLVTQQSRHRWRLDSSLAHWPDTGVRPGTRLSDSMSRRLTIPTAQPTPRQAPVAGRAAMARPDAPFAHAGE